jgi:hypothetical protein
MRPRFRTALAAVALVVMAVMASSAQAVSGPGANENSKFVYTEDIVGTDLALTFNEGSQKRFDSVTYDLYVVASYFSFCGERGLGESREVRQTLTVTPGEDGRTMGAFAYDFGISDTVCGCGCGGSGTLTVTYDQMTLTNAATGRVYRLDPVTKTYST